MYGEGRDSLLLDGIPQCNVSADGAGGALVNNAKVVSIEYRMPPEHRFPTATDDTLDVLLWLLDHADELRIDPERVSIGGTSAGGNLAAVLGQRALEAGVQLKFQLMLVPVIHYGCSTMSCLHSAHAPLLGVAEILWFHHMYSRPEGGRSGFQDGTHPHYDPTMWGNRCKAHGHDADAHESTNGSRVKFPRMLVVSAGKDALRDDALDYMHFLTDTCGVRSIGTTGGESGSDDSHAVVEHLQLPGSHWSVYQHTDLYRTQLTEGVCG